MEENVKLEKINENITNIKNGVDEVNSEWELATNTVVTTIDKQVDSINEAIKAKEEEAEAAIKPLQDQLDLMEKQNAARKRQLDLEQAQFNLAKAQQEGEVRQDLDPALGAMFFDNLLMMLHFSYGCAYYGERMKLYDSKVSEDELVRQLLLFIKGALCAPGKE